MKQTIVTLFVISCASISFADQRSALVDFYDSTDGDHWLANQAWTSTGDICSWLGVDCENKQVVGITLDRNNIRGPIPDSISELTSLRYLQFEENSISGVSSSISELKNLRRISLKKNSLTSFPFDDVAELSGLQILNLEFNGIQGSLSSNIGNMEALTNFTAQSNLISGSIPDSIGDLANLQELSLGYNQLSGEIPDSLGNLKNLQTLVLSSNSFTGSLPEFSGNLVFIELYNNSLTGPIPSSYGSMSNMQGMDLSSNQLDGEIPSELGNLVNLVDLRLGNNFFGGLIPDLGNLKQLGHLGLENNPFTPDVFPDWLLHIGTLEVLRMNNTQRTGTLPDDLTVQMLTIEDIDLGYNHFTGSMPSKWDWYKLTEVEFQFNPFSGPCPTIDPKNLLVCDFSNIPFSCPLPPNAREKCNAYCE